MLLVDVDTQGQVSKSLGVEPQRGLAELATGDVPPQDAITEARDNLWLLAGGRSLAGIERLIVRKDFGGEQTIAETLARIDSAYDFVILDTSPGWDTLTVNALFYADEVLSPVSMEVMALQSLQDFTSKSAIHPALSSKADLPLHPPHVYGPSGEEIGGDSGSATRPLPQPVLRTHPLQCEPLRSARLWTDHFRILPPLDWRSRLPTVNHKDP